MTTMKDVRKVLKVLGVECSSHYAFNDKRKTFTRRLKIAVYNKISKKELNIISLCIPEAFEVTYKRNCLIIKCNEGAN